MNIKRIVTLTGLIILLAILLVAVGAFISHSVANNKADEIMRTTFDEGWVRQKTYLGLWVDDTFQPMWVVEYTNTSPAVFVDFGPQFGINLFGAIIYMSPKDLVERIGRNKLKVEQPHPPDRQ